jgi:hypothetical protein
VSEVKRYDLFVDASLQAEEGGEWVKWEDYARLKSERDAIRSSKLVYFIHGEGRWANVFEENARLKAEVERLTKAGDAMAKEWVNLEGLYHDPKDCDMIDNWNAAKEGKGQS